MSLSIVKPVKIWSGNLSTTIPIPDSFAGEVLWNAATNYVVGATALSSLTDPSYYTSGIPGIYRALVAGVGSINPENDPIKWEFLYVANRYRMFDSSSSSDTTQLGGLTVAFSLGYAVSMLALYGLVGKSVTVIVTDPVAGQVMNKTYSLRRPPLMANYYNYFFEDFGNYTELLIPLPTYQFATVQVAINPYDYAGVRCSHVVIGRADVVTDDVEYGAALGITDYSRKEKGVVFGEDIFIKRGYSNHAEFSFLVKNVSRNEVKQYLTELRATPVLYIMDGIASIFGYYQDFKITIPYAIESVCTLSIEGLTQ